MAGTPQNDGLKFLTPRDVDLRSCKIVGGKSVPFDSIAEFLNPALPYYTPKAYRYKGFTFKVMVGGQMQEWWFDGGVEDENIAPKNSRLPILFEGFVGTAKAIAAGIVAGTNTYTNILLKGHQHEVNRGGFDIAGVDQGGGAEYAIKDTDGTFNSDTIVFYSNFSIGEYLKIKKL